MEYYAFHKEFRIGGLQITPIHVKIEPLPLLIASHSHSNNSYEIHYTEKGHGSVTVDDHIYHVHPDTLYITGPGVVHAQRSDPSDPITEYCLYLSCRKISDREDFCTLFSDTLFWIGEDQGRIFPLLQDLIRENRQLHPDTREMSELLLKQIILLLTRIYRQHEVPVIKSAVFSSSQAGMMPVIEDAFLYHYKELTLPGLAAKLGLSVRQTQRLLKTGFGITFSQKLTLARMAAAVQLLKNSTLTITEISEQLGYSSLEHFSAAFRRQMGCSPRQYRRK